MLWICRLLLQQKLESEGRNILLGHLSKRWNLLLQLSIFVTTEMALLNWRQIHCCWRECSYTSCRGCCKCAALSRSCFCRGESRVKGCSISVKESNHRIWRCVGIMLRNAVQFKLKGKKCPAFVAHSKERELTGSMSRKLQSFLNSGMHDNDQERAGNILKLIRAKLYKIVGCSLNASSNAFTLGTGSAPVKTEVLVHLRLQTRNHLERSRLDAFFICCTI